MSYETGVTAMTGRGLSISISWLKKLAAMPRRWQIVGVAQARTEVEMDPQPVIRWELNKERRFPFGRSPDPTWFEPIGFPPPWPDRPWTFGVMVASANRVVAWHRAAPDDDPVLGVLGGDEKRPVRIADRRHMRHLRCYGDVAIGAQTLREQPRLLQTPQEPDDPPMPALYEFRHTHGLPAQPRHVIYSLGGCLDVAMPVFNTPGVEAIIVTTEREPPTFAPAARRLGAWS